MSNFADTWEKQEEVDALPGCNLVCTENVAPPQQGGLRTRTLVLWTCAVAPCWWSDWTPRSHLQRLWVVYPNSFPISSLLPALVPHPLMVYRTFGRRITNQERISILTEAFAERRNFNEPNLTVREKKIYPDNHPAVLLFSDLWCQQTKAMMLSAKRD